MIEAEIIPIVFLDQLEEKPDDLPPPQLHSGSSYSSSNASNKQPSRISPKHPPRAPETSEDSLEGILQEGDQHERVGERIQSEESIENQPRAREIIIEEPEPKKKRIRKTYSNTERTGPITRVFNIVIQPRNKNMKVLGGDRTTSPALSQIRRKKQVIQRGRHNVT